MSLKVSQGERFILEKDTRGLTACRAVVRQGGYGSAAMRGGQRYVQSRLVPLVTPLGRSGASPHHREAASPTNHLSHLTNHVSRPS